MVTYVELADRVIFYSIVFGNGPIVLGDIGSSILEQDYFSAVTKLGTAIGLLYVGYSMGEWCKEREIFRRAQFALALREPLNPNNNNAVEEASSPAVI